MIRQLGLGVVITIAAFAACGCGAEGNVSDELAVTCVDGSELCEDVCVATATDPMNCGVCGVS